MYAWHVRLKDWYLTATLAIGGIDRGLSGAAWRPRGKGSHAE